MHLLLPPSEAKNAGGRGRPLRSRAGAATAMSDTRRAALAALLELVAGDRRTAADALSLPPGVVDAALAVNAAVLDSPTTPALRRYAGVVYGGLDFDRMDAAHQRVAGRSTWIFSGLFGVVRGDEPVPDYRVPAKARLPGLGVAGTRWRPVLDDALPALLRRGPVIDLRSSDYSAMWRPRGRLAERTVSLRVLSPTPRGGHAVISVNSKLGKGRLAAALVDRVVNGQPVAGVEDIAEAWTSCGGVGVDVRDGGRAVDLYTS